MLNYFKTEDMAADIVTKPLGRIKTKNIENVWACICNES